LVKSSGVSKITPVRSKNFPFYKTRRITISVFLSTCQLTALLLNKFCSTSIVTPYKKLNSDKSPDNDGITNRMIQAAGRQFQKLVCHMFGTLWTHDIQPAAWQMSLMQSIYKGGNKSRADPASYRGIYLSSALAKLFEDRNGSYYCTTICVCSCCNWRASCVDSKPK